MPTILFIHQNFPGQFVHVARYLAAQKEWNVHAIGSSMARDMPGVTVMRHEVNAVSGPTPDVRRGLAAAEAARRLRASGVVPDIIYGHSGWGELLFIRDVFPKARLVAYLEFYFSAEGADVDFDPEFPRLDESALSRLRLRNTPQLHAAAESDALVTPTQWQRSRFPSGIREKIHVIHEGVDTQRLTPHPGITVEINESLTLTRKDEVITYVARGLEPYRGFHVFMRAVPEILRRRPTAQILVVGDDEPAYGAPPNAHTNWRERLLDEITAKERAASSGEAGTTRDVSEKGDRLNNGSSNELVQAIGDPSPSAPASPPAPATATPAAASPVDTSRPLDRDPAPPSLHDMARPLETKQDPLDLSRLHFLGRVPYDDYVGLLQLSRVHVYLTYPFVLSWSLIEAMSCGALIVASQTKPVEEVIIDRETGLLVDFFDHRALAATLCDQLERQVHPDPNTPQEGEVMRRSARRLATSRFEVRQTVPQLVRLLMGETMLAEPSKATAPKTASMPPSSDRPANSDASPSSKVTPAPAAPASQHGTVQSPRSDTTTIAATPTTTAPQPVMPLSSSTEASPATPLANGATLPVEPSAKAAPLSASSQSNMESKDVHQTETANERAASLGSGGDGGATPAAEAAPAIADKPRLAPSSHQNQAALPSQANAEKPSPDPVPV